MVDDHIRLRFQCSPYHTNSALYPIIEHLERAAGFERDDGPEVRLTKLEGLMGLAGANLAEAVPLIAALLGVPTGDRYPPLAMSPERQKERTLATLGDQAILLSETKPVLMIVEDAHWIDPTTQESVDLTIGRAEGARLLVVVTGRPEYRPNWLGRPNATMLVLNRLSKRQGAELVEGVTGGISLPSEVLEQVVARTDGVPLFVEELTRTVMESGILREQDGRYVLDGPLPPLAIPATLHDSLMARLDRLVPAKEVAQAGAAIGRTFRHDLLAAVLTRSDADLRPALE
jgi:predicted ATPase